MKRVEEDGTTLSYVLFSVLNGKCKYDFFFLLTRTYLIEHC